MGLEVLFEGARGVAVQKIFSLFPEEVCIVGGAVRDALLGRPIKDIDFACQLPVSDFIERAACFRVVPTGLSHGTVTLIVDGFSFEVTQLRQDVTTDGRRARVAATTDWRVDAWRRDFTVNALYVDSSGVLHDPTGQGLQDIALKRVRFVGEAKQRLTEDALRALRYFRMKALLEDKTMPEADLRALSVTDVSKLSKERVWAEVKALVCVDDGAMGMKAFYQTGLLGGVFQTVPYLSWYQGAPHILSLRLKLLLPHFDFSKLPLSRAERASLDFFDFLPRASPRVVHAYAQERFMEASWFLKTVYGFDFSGYSGEVPHFTLNAEVAMTRGLQGKQISQFLKFAKELWLSQECPEIQDEWVGEVFERFCAL